MQARNKINDAVRHIRDLQHRLKETIHLSEEYMVDE
jgi:hypothetical protein